MYFLVNASPHKLFEVATANFDHMMSRVLGDVLFDLDPKVKGQILYFLENASPHDVLEVATSNFACA